MFVLHWVPMMCVSLWLIANGKFALTTNIKNHLQQKTKKSKTHLRLKLCIPGNNIIIGTGRLARRPALIFSPIGRLARRPKISAKLRKDDHAMYNTMVVLIVVMLHCACFVSKYDPEWGRVYAIGSKIMPDLQGLFVPAGWQLDSALRCLDSNVPSENPFQMW